MTSSLAHISEKPWSSYSQSDYDISQWHRACLIHNHTGTPTSKSECKVPVKTPDGTLSRSGVHAAAAALAGARGGVQASAEQMASAKTALRGLYSQLNETPPDSLQHSNVDFYTEAIEDFLSHHGVRGMHWGVRRSHPGPGGSAGPGRKTVKKQKRLDKVVAKRSQREKQIHQLNKTLDDIHKNGLQSNHMQTKYGKDLARKDITFGLMYGMSKRDLLKLERDNLENERDFQTSLLKRNDKKIKKLNDNLAGVQHDAMDEDDDLDEFDDIDEFEDLDEIEHFGLNDFIEHTGVKGMHWGVRRSEGGKGGGKSSSTSHPTHEDFARATSLHTTAKSHGTRVLSNKEMKDVIDRMNLEQQYSKLTVAEGGGSKAVKVGKGWAGGVLKNVSQQAASEILKGHLMAQVAKAGFLAKK